MNGDNSNIICVSGSEVKEIHNVSISHSNNFGLLIKDTTVDSVSQLKMLNTTQCFQASKSSIVNLVDSEFESWGSSTQIMGGAIYLDLSNSSISNSTFTKNTAKSGGSIALSWSLDAQCSLTLINNSFSQNSASVKGGAIYYNFNRPDISNCLFCDNTAPYGNDIASYAVKIVETSSKNHHLCIEDVASGLLYNHSLYFDLIDFDGQTMNLENSHTIKVSPVNVNASVKGTDSAKINNGTALFDNLIFESTEGEVKYTSITQFELTSKAIDSTIINTLFGGSIQNYTNLLDVKFRYVS